MPRPIITTSIPPLYKKAIESETAAQFADHPAKTPAELFGRGLCRTAIGRWLDARQDFQAAMAEIGDPCLVELAYLDLSAFEELDAIRDEMQIIAERNVSSPMLAGRALHVAGLAAGKRSQYTEAVDLLLRASSQFQLAGCQLGHAQVLDSVGMFLASQGRLEDAIHHYALSIAGKAVVGNIDGIALSLGQMGRVHLQAGRFQRALECFKTDLEIVDTLGDQRTKCGLLTNIGRVHLASGDLQTAEQALLRARELASSPENQFKDHHVFACKDLVQVCSLTNRGVDARLFLAEARQLIGNSPNPYFRAHVAHAEGILEQRSNPRLSELLLREAVGTFQELEVPEFEIESQIALAQTLIMTSNPSEAWEVVLSGLRNARSKSIYRLLPKLNSLIEALRGGQVARSSATSDGSEHATLLNRYLIRDKLGAGTFGEVYRVYDCQRTEEVALKILRTGGLYNPRERNKLQHALRQELAIGTNLHPHPGIVRIHDIDTLETGDLCIVQQLVQGSPLTRLISPMGTKNLQGTLVILAYIAEALAHLHDLKIIHRDLKPANIIVQPNGLPILIDFGISVIGNRRVPANLEIQGTLPYMSPEQARGKRIDGRSDLYSLGVIAYELLTGDRPIQPRIAWKDAVQDISYLQPQRLIHKNGSLPLVLDGLVLSLLQKRPYRRPADAASVAVAIREIIRKEVHIV